MLITSVYQEIWSYNLSDYEHFSSRELCALVLSHHTVLHAEAEQPLPQILVVLNHPTVLLQSEGIILANSMMATHKDSTVHTYPTSLSFLIGSSFFLWNSMTLMFSY